MRIEQIAREAKKASILAAAMDTELKNNALRTVAKALEEKKADIIVANQEDLKRSERENLAGPLLKRLKFDEAKINDVISGIKSLIDLDDPVGKVQMTTELDEGLKLFKVSCSIGVIGVIFESRPDALVQIATLCLKSSNAVMLKGGSEAKKTNRILTDIIAEATESVGMPKGWIRLLETREDVSGILALDQYIDLIIPRGSNEFVKFIIQNSDIPVLGHADGICHCYIDKAADINKAVTISNDSKTQYVAACNATETILVHKDIAENVLPKLQEELSKSNVIIYGCDETAKNIPCNAATEEDYQTEYLDYMVAVKVVGDIDEAIHHINQYGSGHTDVIVTEDEESWNKFITLVDSGNVFLNCSTRFSDGFRYGFGAEVGISTNKIHARGPVGLEGLLIYKYKLIGNGHIVKDYAEGKKAFTHKKIR